MNVITKEYVDSIISLKQLMKEDYCFWLINFNWNEYIATVYKLEQSFLIMLEDEPKSVASKKATHCFLSDCFEDVAILVMDQITKKFNNGEQSDELNGLISRSVWIQDDRRQGGRLFQVHLKYVWGTNYRRFSTAKPGWTPL